jgi:hypothetical protein
MKKQKDTRGFFTERTALYLVIKVHEKHSQSIKSFMKKNSPEEQRKFRHTRFLQDLNARACKEELQMKYKAFASEMKGT